MAVFVSTHYPPLKPLPKNEESAEKGGEMTLVINSERWCEETIGRSTAGLRAIRCSDVAIYVCANCGRPVCDAHERSCGACGRIFCSRCDHDCRVGAQIPAA